MQERAWGKMAVAFAAAIAMGGNTHCQLVGDLGAKELVFTDGGLVAEMPNLPAPADAGDAGTESVSPNVVLPKPGCTEGRRGATMDCGVGASRDCCETSSVTGGSFALRTGTIDDDHAVRTAEIRAFTMDVFEVTVGRFRAFVDAGGGVQGNLPKYGAGAHPAKAESGWRDFATYMPRDRAELDQQLTSGRFATWSSKPEGREHYPIAGVTWYMAMAFCIWDGGRLPTDAEWAYAAAGGAEERKYPWGDEMVADAAVWQCGDHYGSKELYSKCTSADLLPVGSRPNGRARWGHEDMLGSADEWLLDIYCAPPVSGVCKDCVTTGSCFQRTARGGDVRMFADEASRAYSRWLAANEPSSAKGFRCVRSSP